MLGMRHDAGRGNDGMHRCSTRGRTAHPGTEAARCPRTPAARGCRGAPRRRRASARRDQRQKARRRETPPAPAAPVRRCRSPYRGCATDARGRAERANRMGCPNRLGHANHENRTGRLNRLGHANRTEDAGCAGSAKRAECAECVGCTRDANHTGCASSDGRRRKHRRPRPRPRPQRIPATPTARAGRASAHGRPSYPRHRWQLEGRTPDGTARASAAPRTRKRSPQHLRLSHVFSP